MSIGAPIAAEAAAPEGALELGRFKRARRAYGFDEVAIVPGRVTINPAEVDIRVSFGRLELAVPILAAAMDGVVDVPFAIEMGRLGGLAVLNLDGLQTRSRANQRPTPEGLPGADQGGPDRPAHPVDQAGRSADRRLNRARSGG
jgi:hypothetical protein